MNKIISINPADLLAQTNSTLFLIVLVTAADSFYWNQQGFHNVEEDGFRNKTVFKKNVVAEEYGHALAAAEAASNHLYSGGNLELVGLPGFQTGKI